MTPLQQFASILRKAQLENIDNIYMNNIPEEQMDNVDLTIALAQGVRVDPTRFGSNDFFGVANEVELQIFYKKDLDFDTSQLELQIMKLLTHNDWKPVNIEDHALDPDTQQEYITMYFRNNQTLNEKGEIIK